MDSEETGTKVSEIVSGCVAWCCGRVSDKTIWGTAVSSDFLDTKNKCIRCLFRFENFAAGLQFVDPRTDEPCEHQTISFIPVALEGGQRYVATEIVLHGHCEDHGHQQYLEQIKGAT